MGGRKVEGRKRDSQAGWKWQNKENFLQCCIIFHLQKGAEAGNCQDLE